MNVILRKKLKYFRYLVALFIIVLMVFCSEYLNCQEIIFPEILALVTSCLVVEKMPWNCSKNKLFVLMSISAFFGVLVTKYVHSFVIIQVLLCLIFSGTLFNLFKTNLLPLISASILPVYLKTETFVYPISVSILSLLIVITLWILENTPLKVKHKYVESKYNTQQELIFWVKISVLLTLITLIPYNTNNLFFIAPPLIVTFVEFAKSKNKSISRAKKIIALLFIAAILGTCLKLFLYNMFPFSETISAMFGTIFLFFIFEKFRMVFHPAGAILLIPYLLENNLITYYPLQILVGSVVIILFAKYLFK